MHLVNKSFSDITDISIINESHIIHFNDYDLNVANIENIYDNNASSRVFSELANEYLNTSPTITSSATSTVDENSPVETVIYDVEATDPENDSITYSLGTGGDLFTQYRF